MSPPNLRLSKTGRFRPGEEISPPPDSYSLMPFRFERLEGDEEQVVVVNDLGEYLLITHEQLVRFATGMLEPTEPLYRELRSHQFLFDRESISNLDVVVPRLRLKKQRVSDFTALNMFVVTLRCNQSCPYCQVSRQSEDRAQFDMPEEVAKKGVEFAFRSPSPDVKIEFQGGESLLNFELIKSIVIEAEARNETERRSLEFVAATNMTFLTDEILDFFREHNILVSTSIDGPADLHNKNRPYKGHDAFAEVCANIARARSALGPDRVAALMTTTRSSLTRPREIIDQYLELGFNAVFFRPLSPYGFAIKTKSFYEYSADEFLDFWKEGLDYIIELNRNGVFIIEHFTSILLDKMFSRRGTGYVNLQSPAGNGIAGIVYNYDGYVYASDEGRMIAEMGDHSLRLGHLLRDGYDDILGSDVLLQMLDESLAESSPQCADCGFQPWCGSDPDYHYAMSRDFTGHKPTSGFCKKNTGAFNHIIRLMAEGGEPARILKSWVR